MTASAQVRQVDVFPTVPDLLDVEYDCEAVDGRSLLPPDDVDSRDAYVRACGLSLMGERNWKRAVRADGAKYVEYPNKDWRPELYDLEADPCEIRGTDDRERMERMAEKLPDEDLMDVDRIEIDDLLRDLGYR